MNKVAKKMIVETLPERVPAPPELVQMAQSAVREFQSCFWFWHRDAKVRFLDDVDLVIRHLREYGGWEAWGKAQELKRCL